MNGKHVVRDKLVDTKCETKILVYNKLYWMCKYGC